MARKMFAAAARDDVADADAALRAMNADT